ncbi:MAG TPA: hypothetical protein VFH06_02260 [Candidatus Saccharimonadales bacterium]|nr:hypothetical protein [Candidatus Saccharimonadales bacterium]
MALREYMTDRDSVLLELTIDSKYCYVSDLDKYDAVKSSLLNNNKERAFTYAQIYWRSITNLAVFQPGTIARPEVMIVKDLPPDAISVRATP